MNRPGREITTRGKGAGSARRCLALVGRRYPRGYLKRTRDAAPKEADLPPGSPTISPSLSGVLRSHHFFFLFFFLVRVKEKGRFLQQLSRGRREVGSDPRSSLNPQRPLAAAPTSLPGCASVFGARITLRARFLVWAIFGGGPNRRFLLQNGSPTLEFREDFRKYQNPDSFACFGGVGGDGGDGGDGGGRGKVLERREVECPPVLNCEIRPRASDLPVRIRRP